MEEFVVGKSTGWATWARLGLKQGYRDSGNMLVVLLRGFYEGLNVSDYEGVVGLLYFCGGVGGGSCVGVDGISHTFELLHDTLFGGVE